MTCPKCGSENTLNWGKVCGKPRIACSDCGRTSVVGARSGATIYRLSTCPKCNSNDEFAIAGMKRGIRYMSCTFCGRQTRRESLEPQKDASGTRFLITAAQNATRVSRGFLSAIKNYAAHRKADIIIVPMRYRNPTRPGEDTDDNWWHKDLTEYLVDQRLRICKGLQLLSDIKVQPTAVSPLSGLDTITGGESAIVGHTKMAMDAKATRAGDLPKLLWTTGACTVQNYSDSKAGKKGEFHHVIGGLVVDVVGGKFHVTQIIAERDGSFIHLDKRYTPSGVEDAKPAEAVILGDLHVRRADPKNRAAIPNLVSKVKAKRIVAHDVLDMDSASHHHTFFDRFLRRVKGQDCVEDEIAETCAYLDELAKLAPVTVVSSNHHDHLTRWLEKYQNGDDVQNAIVFHRAKAAVLEHISTHHEVPDAFAMIAAQVCRGSVNFLRPNESYSVKGIELGYHGDRGPNGARGTLKAFDGIGVKTVTGHGHSPGIVGGAWRVGTSSLLDMGYNQGPSSWLHTHCIIYANGKRALVSVIDGEFC